MFRNLFGFDVEMVDSLPFISATERRTQLENYSFKFSLNEILSLIQNPIEEMTTRYAAYLYLVANGDLNQISAMARFFDFSYKNSTGMDAVLVAICRGRKDVLSWLLQQPMLTLTTRDKDGYDAVLTAVAYGQEAMLMHLIEPTPHGRGMTFNTFDKYGNDALMVAIMNYQIRIVQYLIQREASVKTTNHYGQNPVLMAVHVGDKEILSYLVHTLKLSMQVTDDEGNDPILTAVAAGQLEMLEMLANDERYHLSINVINNKGMNALFVAIENNQLPMLKVLFTQFSKKFHTIIGPDGNKHSLISAAVGNGHVEILNYLSNECHLSLQPEHNFNDKVVLIAIANNRFEMLHALVSPEGSYQLSLEVIDEDGYGPILTAVRCGLTEMLKVLIEQYHLSLENAISNEQLDCVSVAIRYGQLAILKLLIDPGEDGYGLFLEEFLGIDPVITAVRYGQLEVLGFLIEKGLNIDVIDSHGETVITTAITYNQLPALQLLLKPLAQGGYGKSLNIRDAGGLTPMMIAAKNNNIEMLEFLISNEVPGGGLPLGNVTVLLELCNKDVNQNETYWWVFIHHFTDLVNNLGYLKAFAWAEETLGNATYCQEYLQNNLKNHYKKIIKNNFNAYTHAAAEEAAQALEKIAPCEGNFYIAKLYVAARNFVAAFQSYMKVYEHPKCTLEAKRLAGFELAHLIIFGDVCLRNGILQVEETNKHAELTAVMQVQRKREGMNRMSLQERAITAYEYLYNNVSTTDAWLLKKIDHILADNLQVPTATVWTLDSVLKFQRYYGQKNPELLQAKAFTTSTLKYLNETLEQKEAYEKRIFELATTVTKLQNHQPLARPRLVNTTNPPLFALGPRPWKS